jgi:hypothetical protein
VIVTSCLQPNGNVVPYLCYIGFEARLPKVALFTIRSVRKHEELALNSDLLLTLATKKATSALTMPPSEEPAAPPPPNPAENHQHQRSTGSTTDEGGRITGGPGGNRGARASEREDARPIVTVADLRRSDRHYDGIIANLR